jgi:rhamnulokinase
MTIPSFAAVDLGATSGRVTLAHLEGGRFSLHVTGRFPNNPLVLPDGTHWNIPALYQGALSGLKAAFRESPSIASIGIDSWAVDYGMLRGDALLGLPFHYRDQRSLSGVDEVHASTPHSELYQRNGLQFLHFNTLYQLAAERSHGMLEQADAVLLIPDLIGFWLTGQRVSERTNASTTGLLNVHTGSWDTELAISVGIPVSLLQPLVDPGDSVGTLRATVAREVGAPSNAAVVAVGSHDTASAILAVPFVSPDAAYISCGTWGLVGLELDRPVLSDEARHANFTNERAVQGHIRFLTNAMGLWLLNESIRTWEATGEKLDLAELLRSASAVNTPVTIFDANEARFHSAGDQPSRIREWCVEHDISAPADKAQMVRSIVESLAESFVNAVRTASSLARVTVPAIHIVGGGSLNELLCQAVSNRSGLPVLAGPVEATSLGNVLVQAQAAGAFGDGAEELREIVRNSVEPRRYEPRRWRESR